MKFRPGQIIRYHSDIYHMILLINKIDEPNYITTVLESNSVRVGSLFDLYIDLSYIYEVVGEEESERLKGAAI